MKAFIDTNIFVYATYSSFAQHQKCRHFLQECLSQKNTWCTSWGVVYEYLRVVTHPQIFPQGRLTLALAIENVLKFSDSTNVEIIQETGEHAQHLRALNDESLIVQGNLVHDAHSVILMREHDVEIVYTTDADFNRFKGLKVKSPL